MSKSATNISRASILGRRLVGLPGSFVRFVHDCFKNTARSVKLSAIVAHTEAALLLSFNEQYKPCLIQSGYTLVAFLPVTSKKSEGIRSSVIDELQEPADGLSMTQVRVFVEL